MRWIVLVVREGELGKLGVGRPRLFPTEKKEAVRA